MNDLAQSPLRRIQPKQWLALPLSVALGGLLVALLFAGLRPGAASAAADAVYTCDQTGLNNALAAGGSATFSCGAPTTVVVTAVKTVNKNVTLDGGNKLILSGNNARMVFTVAASVHLNLINLTLRDASNLIGGAIYNNGFLAVTHTQFISNVAIYGAAVFNAPGAWASLSGSTVVNNTGKGGAVWNGAPELTGTVPATLVVAGTTFETNTAGAGTAIFNQAGSVTVSGSTFQFNLATTGGAIFSFASLHVDSSQFTANNAGLVFDSQAAALGQAAGLNLPAASLFQSGAGGAIYAGAEAHTYVSTSTFNGNLSKTGGGAIAFGFLPPASVGSATSGLSIANSSFLNNCSGGPGGALGNGMTATVSNSSFNDNLSDSAISACAPVAANHANQPALGGRGNAPTGPFISDTPGAGGAIFNSGVLAVTGSNFLHNSATVTVAGGGGAIANYVGSSLNVANSTFSDNSALQDGGAIFNAGAALATLSDSDFTHNAATNDSGGAVASLGVLTVTNGTFTRNYGAPRLGVLHGGGGAIFSNAGPVTVLGPDHANGASSGQAPQLSGPANRLYVDRTRFISNSSEYEGGAIHAGVAAIHASTFSGNTAAFGGALAVQDTDFVVDRSTFTANAAVSTTQFAAIDGGAIHSGGYAMSVINSTFFGNFVPAGAIGGAIQVQNGSMGITNSTFISNTAVDSGSGGAFSKNANLIAHNVLIAFNAGGNCQQAMALDAHNLDYPGASCGGSAQHLDPRVLAPANNGGPTLTSALLPGSPAINAGDNTGCPTTDQRGAHRPVGGTCDIGAFEFGGLVARLWLPLVER